jgi:hypothetical protein
MAQRATLMRSLLGQSDMMLKKGTIPFFVIVIIICVCFRLINVKHNKFDFCRINFILLT